MLLMAAVAMTTACGDDTTKDDPRPTPPEKETLVLSVDKDLLVIDTDNVATFTVMYGEKDVTAEAAIYNTADNTAVEGGAFTAAAEGEYTFEASYDGVKSNTVTVVAEYEPTPEPEEPFVIELYDLYATGVTMRVTPEDNETGYYFDVVTKENYDYYENNGWQELISYTLQGIIDGYQMTPQQAVDAITSFGPDEWTFKSLIRNTQYYAVVLGIESSGAITGQCVFEGFQTPDVEMSDNTFEITTANVTYNGADYTVIPSKKEDAYFSNIISKAVADEFESDGELAQYCVSVVPVVEIMLSRGDFTLVNEQVCQPGRDFYVVAFGYDAGVITTPVAKAEFSTPVDADPATCTFEFEVRAITHNSAEVAVTPSNRYNVFFWEAIAVEDFEFFKELFGTDDEQEVMAMFWEEEVLSVMCDDTGMTPAQFVDMAGLWGDYSGGTDVATLNHLSEETEYIVWAVCVDAYGTPVGDFFFSEPFATTAEVISSATAEIKVVAYFNGDELSGDYNIPNSAVVVMEVTPSADAACWFSALYAGDITYSDRYNFINNLTSSGDYMPTMMIKTTPWEQFCTALSVAQDADGNFGEVSSEVFLCSKSEARPAAEFEQYITAAMPLKAAPMYRPAVKQRPVFKAHRTLAVGR